MPAALLWPPPSVPRFWTVNCCSAAVTGIAGGAADGSLVRVASSQAARAAARTKAERDPFHGAPPGAVVELPGAGPLPIPARAGILEMVGHGRVMRASWPHPVPLRCSHFGCSAAPHSTVRTAPSPAGPPCGSASPCWRCWRSSIPVRSAATSWSPLSGPRAAPPTPATSSASRSTSSARHWATTAVLSTGDDLRLNPERLTCDLWEFEAALGRDDLEAAVGLYRGPFLSGFHLSGAEEFERWADGERARLARRYGQALEQLAERQMRGGDPVQAVEWWSRLARRGSLQLSHRAAIHGGTRRRGRPRGGAASRRRALRAAPRRARRGARSGRCSRSPSGSGLESRAAPPSAPRRDPPIAAGCRRPDSDAERPVPAPVDPRTGRPSTPRLARAAGAARRRRGGGRRAGRKALARAAAGARAPAPGRRRRLREPHRPARPRRPRRYGRRLDHPRGAGDAAGGPHRAGSGVRGGTGHPAASPIRWRRPGRTAPGSWSGGATISSGDSVLFQAGIDGRRQRPGPPVVRPGRRAGSSGPPPRSRRCESGSRAASARWSIRSSGPAPGRSRPGPPPSLPAYREFVAGLKEDDDWEPRPALPPGGRLDSTFVAPLIQLAFSAVWADQCAITDSVGAVLDGRRDRLTPWNRITIDLLRARCRGDRAEELRLLEERHLERIPGRASRRRTYAAVAAAVLQPAESRAGDSAPVDPDAAVAGARTRPAWYWWRMAGYRHTLGEYRAELEITERWQDSAAGEWHVIRGPRARRAGPGAGGDGAGGAHVRACRRNRSPTGSSRLATELAAHGHVGRGEDDRGGLLARLELGPGRRMEPCREHRLGQRSARRNGRGAGSARAGRPERCRHRSPGWKRRPGSRCCRPTRVRAEKIDSSLAEQSRPPAARAHGLRGELMLARAHLAAGFGRREQAVALLQEAAVPRAWFTLGSAHVYHTDPLLAPLRGYPPFDALLRPDN